MFWLGPVGQPVPKHVVPVLGATEPSGAVSLISPTGYGPTLVPLAGWVRVPLKALVTFVVVTKRDMPVGMLVNTARRRVPKSAKPAVKPLPVTAGWIKSDSEL